MAGTEDLELPDASTKGLSGSVCHVEAFGLDTTIIVTAAGLPNITRVKPGLEIAARQRNAVAVAQNSGSLFDADRGMAIEHA